MGRGWWVWWVRGWVAGRAQRPAPPRTLTDPPLPNNSPVDRVVSMPRAAMAMPYMDARVKDT